uniref:Thebaine 6-O-demethylase-like isoform X2 n=1 Tax=Nicotiana sylvestris TaxID=4096 RepID=A0A1U7V658_NICSY|nr:PREDICTED: thebaine 6-O-demethylase-like isoform X2 [Nicotiana sylvestris]
MGEASSRKIGSTLKVPSVQELVKQQIAVPLRYIRDDIEMPMTSSILPQVPVIDMEKLLAIQRLHFACIDWGFFRVGA